MEIFFEKFQSNSREDEASWDSIGIKFHGGHRQRLSFFAASKSLDVG